MSSIRSSEAPRSPRRADAPHGYPDRVQINSPGVVRRLAETLGKSTEQQDAEALQGAADAVGASPIALCTEGQQSTVSGVLRSVTLRPRNNVPAVEAELYDGSGQVRLVWLGRRQIGGIVPGRVIVVTGRVTGTDTQPTIFNPRYELREASTA